MQIMQNNKGEFFRFCIVGGICTLIDFFVFSLLHNVIGYRIAMVCGFALSLSVNYCLNIYWTFNKKISIGNAIGMIGAHLFNIFIVRMGLMFLFVNVLVFSNQSSYVFTLAISAISNFFILKVIVDRW